jgi:6-pyruvoyltetrahydropterin/6-carboxytetrahydropterin synthase
VRVRLTKDFTFEAAQTLPSAPEGHKCRGVHGHSFKVEVSVEGDVDPKTGWVYDHARISDAMKPLMKLLDHAYLNDIVGLENPTIKKWLSGSGRNWNRNVLVFARSSCTKHQLRAASIAASNKETTAGRAPVQRFIALTRSKKFSKSAS